MIEASVFRLGSPSLRIQTSYSVLVLAFALVSCVRPANVPPPADPARTLVVRLDFDRYKAAIKGLTRFGDREQGTQRNLDALDWIEAQLRSYGYTTVERLRYEYRGQPRESIYATKVGTVMPQEMYIVSAHMDGRGGGEAANDDGSGSAVVLELARVLGARDVRTTRSVRFIFWNNEETGLNGSAAYVRQRAPLQGQESPLGSGLYPEPRWLGMIQHDMMLFDHSVPPRPEQRPEADINIEYQAASKLADASASLAAVLKAANVSYATTYPAKIGTNMSNTDSRSFQDFTASVSLRENERIREIGNGSNPHWHKVTDRYDTFSDKDFRLGFNAAQTTLGAIGQLVGASIVPRR